MQPVKQKKVLQMQTFLGIMPAQREKLKKTGQVQSKEKKRDHSEIMKQMSAQRRTNLCDCNTRYIIMIY